MALFFALIGGGISYLIVKSGDVKPALDGKCKEENMIKAYGQYWKGYFDFGGKTNRRDYWLAVLVWFLIYIIWMFAGSLVIGGFIDIPQMSEVPTYIGYLEAIYGVINVIPMLSMAVRRLNDAGYDWKILLWNLFPFFGQIAVLIFLCKETGVGLVKKCAREGHRWTYDRAKCLETCSVCAATRPKHNFRAVPDRCINKCTICGTETFRPHKNEPTDDPDFVRCKICGQYAVTLRRFTHEEKDALKFAIDTILRNMSIIESGENRQYVAADALTPMIGYVKKVEKDGITKTEGVKGIEKAYEYYISSIQDAKLLRPKDIGNNIILTSDSNLANRVDRYDIILNTSLKFQTKLEQIIDEKREFLNAKEIIVGVMDSKTGDMLALASTSRYSPSNIRKQDYKSLNSSATEYAYEVGSVFKPFIFAILLANDKINPLEHINTYNGVYKLGKRTIRDTHPEPFLVAEDIIVHSSNIGMI